MNSFLLVSVGPFFMPAVGRLVFGIDFHNKSMNYVIIQ